MSRTELTDPEPKPVGPPTDPNGEPERRTRPTNRTTDHPAEQTEPTELTDRPNRMRRNLVNTLPDGSGALVIRTDFTDEQAWDRLRSYIVSYAPEGLLVDVRTVDDPRHAGMTAGQLRSLVPDRAEYPYLAVADATTFAADHAARDRTLLVIDVDPDEEGAGEAFRAVASSLAEIDANLSLANTDFGDYVEGAGRDGVYRGHEGM
ncbi:hypothetical protein B6E66_35890 [Streptomyces maremycinicus]|nr:hypothetical protein B6E66_35890 [Streptomyces sp. B9173]